MLEGGRIVLDSVSKRPTLLPSRAGVLKVLVKKKKSGEGQGQLPRQRHKTNGTAAQHPATASLSTTTKGRGFCRYDFYVEATRGVESSPRSAFAESQVVFAPRPPARPNTGHPARRGLARALLPLEEKGKRTCLSHHIYAIGIRPEVLQPYEETRSLLSVEGRKDRMKGKLPSAGRKNFKEKLKF